MGETTKLLHMKDVVGTNLLLHQFIRNNLQETPITSTSLYELSYRRHQSPLLICRNRPRRHQSPMLLCRHQPMEDTNPLCYLLYNLFSISLLYYSEFLYVFYLFSFTLYYFTKCFLHPTYSRICFMHPGVNCRRNETE